MTTFLLAFTALFSIVNPLSSAFIFFGATQDLGPKLRAQLSRWVAIYAFSIVAASLYVGGYVLSFFGISLPVLKVAGGIVIAMSGWRMLSGPDTTEERRSATASADPLTVTPSRFAFYPLTMPLTTGPGTISVAIGIGANRPAHLARRARLRRRDGARGRCCSRCSCTSSTATRSAWRARSARPARRSWCA